MAIFTFLLIPLGCVVLASISLLPPLMGKLSGEHVNRPVPEFSLTTDDGKVLTSSHMRGKVVVLAFWATWCEPCWQELPRVEKVYASYQGNQAVLFWAVNARAGGDTDGVAQAYAKKMRVGLPVAYTENANAIRLGVDGYPTIVLLDAPVAFASFTMATMVRNGLNLISRARLRTCSTREADIFGHPADIGIRSISPHYYYLHKYRSYVALGCGLARRSSP